MIDITIRLRDHGSSWVVGFDGPDDSYEIEVDPLDADIPATITDLHPSARTWAVLPTHFAPALATIQPGLPVLKSLGSHLRRRLFADAELVQRLSQEREQYPEHRLLFEVGGQDGLLQTLPLELMFDEVGQRFLALEPGLVLVRSVANARSKSLQLPIRARVLVATAHSDARPRPSADKLTQHAAALAECIEQLGWHPILLPDATTTALQEHIRDGVDVLYVACHGQADDGQAGLLYLRDGTLSGETLASWIDEAIALKRPPAAAILCACSTAAPGTGNNTHGMAQYLARRITAALGFRAPVAIDWALSFTQRLFEELAKCRGFDAAFCEARRRSPRSDPQWALPLLHTRRAPARGLVTPALVPRSLEDDAFHSSPFQLPRDYFTGRMATLERLLPLLDAPETVFITSLEGQGGIGKTEIARWLASTARMRDMPVVWLDRPDVDPRTSLAQMIRCANPDFDLANEPVLRDGSLVRFAKRMRDELGDRHGLVVLDDISSSEALELLRPHASWSVLATTRVDRLHASARQIELDRMERSESIELLRCIRYGASTPTAEVLEILDRLADALDDMPLALELAAVTMRDERLEPAAYLADLQQQIGRAAADLTHVMEVLTRSLAEHPEAVERTFLLFGAFPSVGAEARDVAFALEGTEPVVTRWLDLLTRVRLVNYDADTGLYRLHPRVREEARRRLDSEQTNLAERAAAALGERMEWIGAGMSTSVDLALARWRASQLMLMAIDPRQWMGRTGRNHIARVLGSSDQFLAFQQNVDERMVRIEGAIDLIADVADAVSPRAVLLRARGDLFMRKARLDDAETDYEKAIALFRQVDDRLGEANTLTARGDLRTLRDRLDDAEADYEASIDLHRRADNLLGEANALQARGYLRIRKGEFADAETDYEAAIALHRLVNNLVGLANTLKARGDLRVYRGRLDDAEADYEAAISLSHQMTDRLGEAQALHARGICHMRGGRFDAAETDYEAAISVFQQVDDRTGQADVFQSRGDLQAQQGHWTEALTHYNSASDLYMQLDDTFELSNVYADLARTHAALGDVANAIDAATRALQLGENSQNKYAMNIAFSVLQERLDKLPAELRDRLFSKSET